LDQQVPAAQGSSSDDKPLWTMSAAMYKVAQGQDKIGWVEFLHGKVSTKIRQIQQAHCAIANTWLSSNDWMMQFTG
jgi:hypothetical protein